MRDELRERLAAAIREETLDDFRELHPGDREVWLGNADRALAEFESFMREHGLKMMARPIGFFSNAATTAWDTALLTPWSEDG
jgi:hypothetical protein